MLYHAAMAGRSSLAAVIRHTPSGAASFSVITGPGWHTPAQVTRSSPPHQEKTSANFSLAQSDDADRSLSAVDRSSLRHPSSSLSTSSAFRKKGGSGLSKRSPYSGVQRCRQLQAAITHSGGSRPWSVPPSAPSTPRSCRLPATDQPSLWAPQPQPQRCHHHRRFPRLVRFPRSMASPNRARPARSCTAAEYSNATDQHRPTTPATRRRPAKMTTMDRPAAVRDEEAVGSDPIIRPLVRRVGARLRRRMLLTWLCPGFGTAGTPSAPCPTSFRCSHFASQRPFAHLRLAKLSLLRET
jgi:hypothetical protein